MAKTDFKTIDEYIATFPADAQAKLEEVRACIQKAVPKAEEGISYQIPVFKLGGPVLYFSGHAKHLSVSSPPPTFQEFASKLEGFKVSKSAWQIPYDQKIPRKLIAEIAKHRASANLKKENKKK